MSDSNRVKPVLRDAATVLLLRDSRDGLEVFMTVRHKNIDFAGGALVFPGGAVDATDRSDTQCTVVPAGFAPSSRRELAWCVAAVREVYEEAGVLLATDKQGQRLNAAHIRAINARFESVRRTHQVDMAQLAAQENVCLACDRLQPFAHWITPASRPKRFDTRFYLAPMPPGQIAVHDGHEGIESIWGRPASIVAQADEGRWQLRFPTRITLEKLSQDKTLEEAFQRARNSIVLPVTSRITVADGIQTIHIPFAAGYGFSEADLNESGVIVSRR